MAKIKKFETGRYYVVKLKDERNCEVIREYHKIESIIYFLPNYIKPVLKAIALLISIAFPPLLLITIPLMRVSND